MFKVYIEENGTTVIFRDEIKRVGWYDEVNDGCELVEVSESLIKCEIESKSKSITQLFIGQRHDIEPIVNDVYKNKMFLKKDSFDMYLFGKKEPKTFNGTFLDVLIEIYNMWEKQDERD